MQTLLSQDPKTPMKICLIAEANSIHTIRWARYFAHRGHDVHLISSTSSKFVLPEKVRFHILKGISAKIRFVYPLIYYLNYIFYTLQIKRLIKQINPDILQAHYIVSCGFLAALSGFHPLVLNAWGSDIWVEPQVARIKRFFAEYAIKHADIVAVPSEDMSNFVKNKYKFESRKVQWFPWGIDLGIFHIGYEIEVANIKKNLNIPEDHFIILSPRNMGKLYGIESILRSIPHIVKQYKKVCFVILGGASHLGYKERLIELAEELRITFYVRFVQTYLDETQMAAYYNMSDVFISIPSSDGFSMTILEGMSCGSIPIISKLLAYEQFNSDKNVLFIDRNNPLDIANKVLYCINNPKLKDCFYRANIKMVEKTWDWNKNALAMEIECMKLSDRSNNS